VDKTQALYTCILVFTVRLLLLAHTLLCNQVITAVALAILELISGSRERFALMVDPSY
jgi:hypothetical protein